MQGSGRIELPSGELLRVGYADQNGYPYKSIGKWLIDKGELTAGQATMQGIRLGAGQPGAADRALLNSNPAMCSSVGSTTTRAVRWAHWAYR